MKDVDGDQTESIAVKAIGGAQLCHGAIVKSSMVLHHTQDVLCSRGEEDMNYAKTPPGKEGGCSPRKVLAASSGYRS